MSSRKLPVQPASPLLCALQKHVVPWVREKGMDNVIVAAPSWREFQQTDDPLPDGAHATRQALKSKRVAVKTKRSRGSVLSLVNARWPQDGLYSTSEPVLCFVLAGPVALPLGDYVAHCLPGHAVLMPAGSPRPDGSLLYLDDSRANQGVCSMLSLMPWAGGVECWMNHTENGEHQSHRNPGEHCHVQHPRANLYLESLAEEAVAHSPEYRLHCNGLLAALIAILVREMRLQRVFYPASLAESILYPTARSRLPEQNPIKWAQEYIASHLGESLSIDQVAGQVYMSRAYFTRQFRQITGQSFVEYVTRLRLEKAKVLLLNTKWPLQKISAHLGVSPKRLNAIFLQYEHQTPAVFRQQNHLEN